MTDSRPYAELPHEALSDIAVKAVAQRDAITRERDRLAVENACLRERLAHLEHKPVPMAFARRPDPAAISEDDWADTACGHLVEKRRLAEGADFPHPDERANDPRWPLAMCVVVVVVLSVACWMAVPWLWRGVVWAWGVVT